MVFEGDDAGDAGRVALRRVQVIADLADLGKVALQLPEFTKAGGDLSRQAARDAQSSMLLSPWRLVIVLASWAG